MCVSVYVCDDDGAFGIQRCARFSRLCHYGYVPACLPRVFPVPLLFFFLKPLRNAGNVAFSFLFFLYFFNRTITKKSSLFKKHYLRTPHDYRTKYK